MCFFKKWIEILITQDIEKFVKARSALDNAGIDYKENIQNMGHSTRRSGQIGSLGENSCCSNLYQIYVKKADVEGAKAVIRY